MAQSLNIPARGKIRRGWLSLALVVTLSLVVAWLHLANDRLFESIDQGMALDLRFRMRGSLPSPNDIAIIVIDDRSLAKLGRWPLPRATLAQLVDQLRLAGAKTIGLDILLSEREPEATGQGDQRLADALRLHGHVILAGAMLFNNGPLSGGPVSDGRAISLKAVKNANRGTDRLVKADSLLLPLAEFDQGTEVGHVNQQSLDVGQTRAQYPVLGYGDWVIPSFPLLLAAAQKDLPVGAIGFDYAGTLIMGKDRLPLDDRYGLGLNYLGPAGTIRTYSALDLVEGRIPPALLDRRIVLVGVSATSLGDNFVTPFALSLPGVEVLATATANLLHGDSLIRTPEQRLIEAAMIVLLALSAWLLAFRAGGPRWGLLMNLALLIGWLALCQLAFTMNDRLIAVAGPVTAIALGGGIGLLSRTLQERRLRWEAERHRGNLARYVPPSLVETLADRATPSFDEREQQAAVMFIDLQGFTHASEARSPADTAHFLKAFHSQIEDEVAAHGGIVAQFLGDGAMILWGLPQPNDSDPADALACARAMLLRLHHWRPENRARIGLHFGPVAMAQLGGRHQAQLAAAGDTVNVASRLEAAAKSVGAVLVVSDDLIQAVKQLGREDLINGLQPSPDQPVRGRDKPISFWSTADYAGLT
ncbi:CHASE2 domain-containing protein [Dongia sp.]|uniref:CHASE2 domain-containing protein n=1 Tax=Dongia sp. TaxID=1977262 RepID=UPI0035AE41E8